MYLQPTVAYQVTPWLSLGAGVDIVFGSVELNQRLDLAAAPVPLPGVPPGTIFNVYVESKTDHTKRVLVGSLNFFTTTDNSVPDQVFNITDVLPALGKGGKLDQVNVVFEASTGRSGANEAPTLNAKAHLVVGEVDFIERLQPAK